MMEYFLDPRHARSSGEITLKPLLSSATVPFVWTMPAISSPTHLFSFFVPPWRDFVVAELQFHFS